MSKYNHPKPRKRWIPAGFVKFCKNILVFHGLKTVPYSKYNHPKPKKRWIPPWFFKALQNNQAFHPLKTLSRLAGMGAFFLMTTISKDLYSAVVAFAACVLCVEGIFFIRQEKESTYKSKAFFQKAKTTPQKMDAHHRWVFGIRSIAFAIFIPLGRFELYMLTCFLSFVIVALITGFPRFEGVHQSRSQQYNNFQGHSTPFPTDDSTRTSPGNLASPLYGLAGIFPTR